MGVPQLVEKSDFLASLRTLLGPVRTPKMPTSHPLRASLAPPLHVVCTPDKNTNGGHIFKRNGDSWQNE
ncbi:hypothetical protein [Leptospira interrogans]|uniref:Uncharacterized protein n=1 Tax=Leptospira interrogans serovar Australis str. 200703203 TaxID=1085541 RepID=N1UDY6_LEPIR|nr:hypothetical protein [Leptospira interrogans]EKQ46387.1 hypothetical protein LEP1GSC026_1173 [Leptospira interrogans str. 2002000623]EMY24483.1 hypothetical protein LEP1GSC115_4868 [Leptospira interrogans serovar Australis str. 200703203]EKN87853.1 hypothetical protein LEP1GSC027_2914 [Leptospira interrogans str. 2002000624]EKQ46401.1 hypothetical protein LEP1GSC026_1153 [Leptospira interrogans str. 2002000623]EMJ69284.1 hypothetical protein LEP1GSC033_3524 [Leptospira interrogans str. 2002